MKRKKLIISIISLLIIAGGTWFFSQKPTKGGLKLETAKVSRGSISNSVTATGTVEPVTEVQVGTQVSGIIDKLYVDYNDVVKAGQLIAEMDKVNLKAELASAEAQLRSFPRASDSSGNVSMHPRFFRPGSTSDPYSVTVY